MSQLSESELEIQSELEMEQHIDQVIEQVEQEMEQVQQEIEHLSIEIDEPQPEVGPERIEIPAPRVRVSPYNGVVNRLCSHIFMRGPRVGQNCPNVICINSETLCRTHHNNEVRRERRRTEREVEREDEELFGRVIIGRPRRDGIIVPMRPRPVPQGDEEQQVLDLPLSIEQGLMPAPRPIIRRRGQGRRRNVRVLPNFVIQSPAIPLFDEEKELIYEPCSMCSSKVDEAKVTLDCGCEFHLNCYLLIQNEEHCLKCGDKINKLEEDYSDCSICLEKIKTGKVKTSCNHTFHRDCINSWIRMGTGNHDKCPNCRGDIH